MTDDEAGPTADGSDSTAPTAPADGEVGSMASLLRAAAATGGADGALAVGTVVGGQYRIEQVAGAGGMGLVYRAHDLRLDRAVAIKLGAARSPAVLARQKREAGALAKLTHPNVVVVYQVGEHDGRVFIAMEYVTGGTARAWLAAAPRRWQDVVALYAAAGEGLAAAHAAGLVHRDVKPDNVLVGDDGRPRIADFGLVRALGDADGGGTAADASPDVGATRAGTIMGTPAYMAPEQLAGEPVDARADQFSFCASLWEALHGVRPFGGATPAEIEAAIESSPPVEATGRSRRIPRRVLDVLRRGLRPARDERWPAMRPLLTALRRDPAAGRRRIALVLGGAVLAAAIAIPLALRAGGAADPCTDAPAALAPTWSPARALGLARAIGPSAWPALSDRIESYARAWTTGHRDACRATRVARSQSEDLLDRRMHCLQRARLELDATLTVLERGGAGLAGAATDAVGGLPELAVCANTASLAEQVPMPTDPVARARVDEADQLVAEARAAELDRGQLDPIGKAERALIAARAGGWRPQLALALATHAAVLDDAGRGAESRPLFQEAARVAIAGRSDDTAAGALADLAVSLVVAARPGEAELALDIARSLASRGTSEQVRRRVLGAAAMLATRAGRDEEAIAIRRELAAMTPQEPDAPPEQPASDQFNLAAALNAAGRHGDGEVAATRAVELAEAALGPAHPTVGKYLVSVATARQAQGKLEEGTAAAERALAILESWYGPDDARLSWVLETLGELRRQRGDGAGARGLWERQLALARRHYPADVPTIQNKLALLLAQSGDLAGAGKAAAEVVAVLEQARGERAAELMEPLLLVAYVAREQGRLEESVRDFRRALAIAETAQGPEHPASHNLRVELGRTLLAAGGRNEARPLLERVVAATTADAALDPMIFIESHLVLAELVLRQPDRARARTLVDRAAARAAAAPDRPDLVAMVADWRAHHPTR